MRKKCYHFFGGLLNAQANWLNKMSEKGYRLIRAGKMLYEFEECKPNEVKYCVEFIGEKSKENKSIHLYDYVENAGKVSALLSANNIIIYQLAQSGDSLETYYTNLIGGCKND